jgi:hypothetical protein
MSLLTENVQVKFSKEEKHYLDVISSVYGFKRCTFIRKAVFEKMQRDVPKMRQKYKSELDKIDCPF